MLITFGVAIYLVGMLLIGYLASRRIKNSDDYFVAGRSLPWWLVTAIFFFIKVNSKKISSELHRDQILIIFHKPIQYGIGKFLWGLHLAEIESIWPKKC